MLLAALFVCNRVLLGAIGSCAAGAIWQSCRITAVRMCVCSSRFFFGCCYFVACAKFHNFCCPYGSCFYCSSSWSWLSLSHVSFISERAINKSAGNGRPVHAGAPLTSSVLPHTAAPPAAPSAAPPAASAVWRWQRASVARPFALFRFIFMCIALCTLHCNFFYIYIFLYHFFLIFVAQPLDLLAENIFSCVKCMTSDADRDVDALKSQLGGYWVRERCLDCRLWLPNCLALKGVPGSGGVESRVLLCQVCLARRCIDLLYAWTWWSAGQSGKSFMRVAEKHSQTIHFGGFSLLLGEWITAEINCKY